MSDPTITIKTPEDYQRVSAQQQASFEEVLTTTKSSKMSDTQAFDMVVDAEFPYLKTMADPTNSAAAEGGRDAVMKDYGERATLITAADHPDLVATLNMDTAKLNRLNGVNYPPPTMIAIEGLEKDTGSPASYNPTTQTVQVDANRLLTPEGTANVGIILGHELDHRYKGTEDANLKNTIRVNAAKYMERKPEVAAVEHRAQEEAHADYRGAQLVKSGVAYNNALTDMVSQNGTFNAYTTEQEAKARQNGVPIPASIEEEITLDAKRREDFNHQSPKERAALNARVADIADKNNFDNIHPTIRQRQEAMAGFDKTPDLANSRDASFTPKAKLAGIDLTQVDLSSVRNSYNPDGKTAADTGHLTATAQAAARHEQAASVAR